eukprot:TRINITY_DN68327_c0_g1_i1.p1 TRINITY_DN68327_c0_g1~~TRINITY_DN68327_c0_g1_i1.p1  ORF type:complete len:373 (+),score=34.08 TRINITY_DN68327_c0_g1_i1:28-1146(+)
MDSAFLLLLVCTIVHVNAWKPPPGFPKRMPVGTVDLDSPPEKRWEPLVSEIIAKHTYNYSFSNALQYWDKHIPAAVRPIAKEVARSAEHVLNPEYLAEIKGILATLKKHTHDPWELSTLIAINLIYELTSGCTSIVSVDKSNTIWHSRNMDWAVPAPISFTNFTYMVEFTQGGHTLYTGVHYVGFIGIATGMRGGAFAMTLDARFTLNPEQILDNIIHLEKDHAQPVTWLAREVLHHNKTYDVAQHVLATGRIASPVYYILSGLHGHQGSVMSRNWNTSVHGVWSMPNGPKPWYILETNYDHWGPVAPGDDRRKVAEDAMDKMGQANISPEALFKVMQTPGTAYSRGVLNSETRYTVVVSPEKNHFDAYLMQ